MLQKNSGLENERAKNRRVEKVEKEKWTKKHDQMKVQDSESKALVKFFYDLVSWNFAILCWIENLFCYQGFDGKWAQRLSSRF